MHGLFFFCLSFESMLLKCALFVYNNVCCRSFTMVQGIPYILIWCFIPCQYNILYRSDIVIEWYRYRVWYRDGKYFIPWFTEPAQTGCFEACWTILACNWRGLGIQFWTLVKPEKGRRKERKKRRWKRWQGCWWLAETSGVLWSFARGIREREGEGGKWRERKVVLVLNPWPLHGGFPPSSSLFAALPSLHFPLSLSFFIPI